MRWDAEPRGSRAARRYADGAPSGREDRAAPQYRCGDTEILHGAACGGAGCAMLLRCRGRRGRKPSGLPREYSFWGWRLKPHRWHKAGRGKVRGAGAQLPVNFVALKVHRRAGLPLDPYLDAWRLGEGIEYLRGLSLGQLSPVKINTDMDALDKPETLVQRDEPFALRCFV